MKPLKKVKYIIVHCSATPEGKDYTAADIDRWHRQQGWECIGYHYVVRLDGMLEPGRSIKYQGAHCKPLNAVSIGICYIGGLSKDGKPKDTRTDVQKMVLYNFLAELKEQYPDAEIHGHRDFAPKACPCFDATKEYSEL